MPDVAELGQLVKAKFPGVYDHVDPAQLGTLVRGKYPAYSHYTDLAAGPSDERVGPNPPGSDVSRPAQGPDLSGEAPIAAHQLEILADYPGASSYAEAAARERAFASKPAIVRALAQPAAGFVEQVVPSAEGLGRGAVANVRRSIAAIRSLGEVAQARGFEAPAPLPDEAAPGPSRDLTPLVPAARTTGQKIARGLGGAAGYAIEAAALTPVVGPTAAAAIPSMTGSGTLEQRAIRGATMGAGGGILHGAAALTEAAPAAVKAAAGVAAPAITYGSIVPYIEAAARKSLGEQGVEWPKAGDVVPSAASLLLFGAGMHAASAVTGRPQFAPDRVGAPVQAQRTSEPDTRVATPKELAWLELARHVAEPPFPNGTTPEQAVALRAQSDAASAQMRDALQGKRIAVGSGNRASVVTVVSAKVFPYPGERTKVRLIVEDAASGQRVPLGFSDVAALRNSLRPLPGVEQPALPGAPEPRAAAPERQPSPGLEPTGFPASEAPERVAVAKNAVLRVTGPGVAEALVEHFAYGKELHPIAEAAMKQSLGELTGVMGGREVRRIARSSRDADAFRSQLRQRVFERLGIAAAPEPVGAVEQTGAGAPASVGEGAAPSRPTPALTSPEPAVVAAEPKAPGPERATGGGAPAAPESSGKGAIAAEPTPTQIPRVPLPEAPASKDIVRGARVESVRGSYKGDSGFVLDRKPGGLVRVRWLSGREAVDVAQNLRARPGHTATQEELARIEAVQEPTIPRSYKKGEEPPPRPPIEHEVATAVAKRAGLRPLVEQPLRMSALEANRMSSTDQFVTDGRVLFLAKAIEPKFRERLHERAANKGAGPKIEPVIAEATKGKMARLQPLGWTHAPGEGHRGEEPIAVFRDEKSGQMATVNPEFWKITSRAVAPDTYEQAAGKPLNAIVLKRGGELVGLMMPIRASDEQLTYLRDVLGEKAAPAGVARNAMRYDEHTGRLAVHPEATVADLQALDRAVRRKLSRTESPVAVRKLTGLRERAAARIEEMSGAPAPRGEVPAPSTVPHVPTRAEAGALPSASVPEVAKAAKPSLAQRARSAVKQALDEVIAVTNPVHLAVREAPESVDALHRYLGELNRALWRAGRTQKTMLKFWDSQPREKVMAYWDAIEHGKPPGAGLEDFAAAERQRYDQVFQALSQHKDIPYFDNYIGHLWKKNEAAAHFFATRRTMEGTKRWTRERFFADKRAAMEAGLQPVTWNPERELQAIEHDARAFVLLQHLVSEFKGLGSAKLVRPGEKPPEGWVPFDGRWAKLYLPPNIDVSAWHDAKQMEALQQVAAKLGIKSEMKMRPGGKMLGFSESSPGQVGRVVRRFATPLSVLAHEIGHQLDSKYGLQKIFLDTRDTRKELRALADLRTEGSTPSPSFKSYVRSAPEKMAVMLEAWLHTPDRFKEVAPKTFEKLRLFLAVHPETKPLLEIKGEGGQETVVPLRPSLTYSKETGQVSAGGVVLGGQYYAQPDLARIVNNHMSQDLIMGSSIGRGVMHSRNWLNMMQLGFSAFHGTAIAQVAFENQLAIGIREMAVGDFATKMHGFGEAVKSATVVQPIIRGVREGWKLYRGDPQLIGIERELFAGGAKLDAMLNPDVGTSAGDIFMRNLRRISTHVGAAKVGPAAKAAIMAPFAAVEAPIRLLATSYIPQAKIAAWRDLYASELRLRAKDLGAGTLSHDQLARETWREIDNRMGLLNYDNLFWNRTLKSAVMVLIRAPGWRLGTARALGGAAFIDLPRLAGRAVTGRALASDFTPRMAYALSATFAAMTMNGIYHYLHTRRRPQTLEDYVHPDTGARDADGRPIRAQFPNYIARDVAHAVTDWRGYLMSGVAPQVMLVYELLRNQSYRGPIHRPIKEPSDLGAAAEDVLKYLFYSVTPISVKQRAVLAKGHATPEQQAETALGIVRAPQKAKPRQRRFVERSWGQ